MIGRRCRPQRFGQESLAVARRRQRLHIRARNGDFSEQTLHRILRVVECGHATLVQRCSLVARQHLPGLGVERRVQAGQHHGAVRQAGDGCNEFGR